MIIKKLKRHLEELVTPELEPLSEAALTSKLLDARCAKNVLPKNKAVSQSSFEETYRTSYSHGLEQIYAIETVDLKSVRVLGSSTEKPPEIIEKLNVEMDLQSQMEFDFKGEGKSALDSFLLDEPIMVLGLSKHAENTLRRLEKYSIKDLLQIDLKNLAHVKGMGQGHIDEIEARLNQYLFQKPLYGCLFIDFESWVKTLLPENERKKCYVILEAFDLSHLISLSPLESVEVRKLTVEKKQEWQEEGFSFFRTEEKRALFTSQLSRVMDALIIPWIRERSGIIRDYELEERFDKLGAPSTFGKAWKLFEKLYAKEGNLFQKILPHQGKELYFADKKCQKDFEAVIEKALSYFYHKQARYPLDKLIDYVAMEFSSKWQGFPDGFITKALRRSSRFGFKREKNGLLIYLHE